MRKVDASIDSLTERTARCSRDAIQRSSTRFVRGPGSTSSRASISTSRDAFHILLARSRPCWTRASENRTSCADDIASSPKRSASAPCRSISSSGSMPVPRLFDMRRPSGAWMIEWT